MAAELPRAEYPWQNREHDKRLEELMHARIAETQAGDLRSRRAEQRFMDSAESGFAGQSVSGGTLDAQQASVGGKPDGTQFGQIAESTADGEVAGVVDGGFGAQGATLLVVLFDGKRVIAPIPPALDGGFKMPQTSAVL
jgi:hypothetical protein